MKNSIKKIALSMYVVAQLAFIGYEFYVQISDKDWFGAFGWFGFGIIWLSLASVVRLHKIEMEALRKAHSNDLFVAVESAKMDTTMELFEQMCEIEAKKEGVLWDAEDDNQEERG